MLATVYSDQEFWLNPKIDKSHLSDLKPSLECRACQCQPMHNFQLVNCDLHGINLVNRGQKQGFDLSNAELYHANLKAAHMFAINLQGASLMKADLRGANLHCADLRDANLLGVKLGNTRLDNVKWGDCVLQERLGNKAAKSCDFATALDYYEQAEEIYRNLHLNLEKEGLIEQASVFFYKEMVMRRKRLPRNSLKRLLSKAADVFCGYGENPLRLISCSMVFIFICSLFYFTLGIVHSGEIIGLSLQNGLFQNTMDFLSCIYFSVVTFTTLGYGDLTPVGFVRPVAALEAFTGSFSMALFVVLFYKKMSR